MTKRTYWDRDGNLWEESDHTPAVLVLIWRPDPELVTRVCLFRDDLIKYFGPLVGVA